MFALVTEPLCWLLGYAYMPYMSFKVLQTPTGKDDKKWLTSWVIFSMVSMLQTIPLVSTIVVLLPFYFEIKFIIVVYCIFFDGSITFYEKVVSPIFKRYEKSADKLVEDLPGTLQASYQELGKSKFVKQALMKGKEFVLEHGPEAYSTVLAIAAQEAKEGHCQQNGGNESHGNIQTSIELRA